MNLPGNFFCGEALSDYTDKYVATRKDLSDPRIARQLHFSVRRANAQHIRQR